jgi:hypothetical protein
LRGVWAGELLEEICQSGMMHVDVCGGGVFALLRVAG